MLVLKIFWLFLLIVHFGPLVTGDSIHLFKNETDAKSLSDNRNNVTYVTTKNLSGNVEMESLEILTTTIPPPTTTRNEYEEEITVNTIIDGGNKKLTVANDQDYINKQDKLQSTTPFTIENIEGNTSYSESVTKNLTDVHKSKTVINGSTSGNLEAIHEELVVSIKTTINPDAYSDTDYFTKNEINNQPESEDFNAEQEIEDVSNFLEIDKDFLLTTTEDFEITTSKGVNVDASTGLAFQDFILNEKNIDTEIATEIEKEISLDLNDNYENVKSDAIFGQGDLVAEKDKEQSSTINPIIDDSITTQLILTDSTSIEIDNYDYTKESFIEPTDLFSDLEKTEDIITEKIFSTTEISPQTESDTIISVTAEPTLQSETKVFSTKKLNSSSLYDNLDFFEAASIHSQFSNQREAPFEFPSFTKDINIDKTMLLGTQNKEPTTTTETDLYKNLDFFEAASKHALLNNQHKAPLNFPTFKDSNIDKTLSSDLENNKETTTERDFYKNLDFFETAATHAKINNNREAPIHFPSFNSEKFENKQNTTKEFSFDKLTFSDAVKAFLQFKTENKLNTVVPKVFPYLRQSTNNVPKNGNESHGKGNTTDFFKDAATHANVSKKNSIVPFIFPYLKNQLNETNVFYQNKTNITDFFEDAALHATKTGINITVPFLFPYLKSNTNRTNQSNVINIDKDDEYLDFFKAAAAHAKTKTIQEVPFIFPYLKTRNEHLVDDSSRDVSYKNLDFFSSAAEHARNNKKGAPLIFPYTKIENINRNSDNSSNNSEFFDDVVRLMEERLNRNLTNHIPFIFPDLIKINATSFPIEEKKNSSTKSINETFNNDDNLISKPEINVITKFEKDEIIFDTSDTDNNNLSDIEVDKVSSLESEQIYYVSNSHDSKTELNINNNVDNEVNITQEKIEFDEQINEIELEKLDKQEPYINGCILNRNASFVVRIMEKDSKFYVPHDAYLYDNKENSIIYITWKSSENKLNNTLIFNLSSISGNYVINGVELNIVKDNDMLVLKKNALSLPSPAHNLDGESVTIILDGNVQIFLSNVNFLRMSTDEKEHSEIHLSTSQLNQAKSQTVAILIGAIVGVICVSIIGYLIVKKNRFFEKKQSTSEIPK